MKAILYDRSSVSTPFAVDALRGRQTELIAYAEKKGIEILEICTDIGYSGSTMERPGLQAALQHIRDGSADVLLLMERGRLNKGKLLEELQNIPVIVLEEEKQREEQKVPGHEL